MAVWVGFIALFGIATDDGVVMATYLTQIFERNTPKNKKKSEHLLLKQEKNVLDLV